MNIKYWYFLSLGIIFLDQLTKILTFNKYNDFIPNIISIYSVQNTGASFSILSGARWFFIILALLFLIGFIVFDCCVKKKLNFNNWYKIGFSLVIGGIIGNLVDRIIYGSVRDFICLEFMNFPIFNVADISLCVGTACVVVWLLFFCDKKEQ